MNACIPVVVTGLACYSFQTGGQSCLAQIPSANARLAALGSSSAALGDVADTRANPAALSGYASASGWFGHAKPFGLPELAVHSANVVAPVGSIVLQGAMTGFGFDAYGVTGVSAGFGAAVSSVGLGLRARFERHRFDGYTSETSVGFDVGWQYEVGGDAVLGALVTGVGSAGFRGDQLSIETGAAVSAGRNVRLVASLHETIGVGADARFGFEARLAEMVTLRLGGSTLAGNFAAGVGLLFGWVSVDAAAVRHPRLGLSPVITVAVGRACCS